MTYRDMTFCKHYEDCAHRYKCPRPYTPEVQIAAEKWWGNDDPPVCYFTNKPPCHSDNEKPDVQNEEENRDSN